MYDTARLRALDSETYLTIPGCITPPPVCFSWAGGRFPAGGGELLLTPAEGIRLFEGFCKSADILCGAYIVYDLGVIAAQRPDLLPEIFKLYAERRVYDVLIAQELDAIAKGEHGIDPTTGGPIRNSEGRMGRYSLDYSVRRALGRQDAKRNDFWRRRYALLDGVPLSVWPEQAAQYPKDDAGNTLQVAQAQLAAGYENLGDHHNQVETAFGLQLGAIWGLRTDPGRVEALAAKVEALHEKMVERFQAVGFIRADGTEDQVAVKRAVVKAYGGANLEPCSRCDGSGRVGGTKKVPAAPNRKKGESEDTHRERVVVWRTSWAAKNSVVCKGRDGGCDGTGYNLDACGVPRTDTGGVSCSRDTLTESGDETLMAYGESESEKIRDTYIPFLRQGTAAPICPRPNVLVASTRTSYDGVIQLLPRKGGVRDCFVARDNTVFCSVDGAALELCALAQVCLWVCGSSEMADTINQTGDPGLLHTSFAASLMGCTTEELARRIEHGDLQAAGFRQASKPPNFGFPARMGAVRLCLTSRSRAAGETKVHATGRVFPGIRFCVLVGGETECGTDKVTDWKGRACPPICRRCLEIVEGEIRPAWFRRWPEISEYFKWITSIVEGNGRMPFLAPDGLVDCERGGLYDQVNFGSAANNGFQGLTAHGMKAAFRAVVRECYLNGGSPLWGTRPIIFAHDEIFSEVPKFKAHLAGPRKAEVMAREFGKYTPDVKVRFEPTLMHYWTKGAKPKYVDGRLVPCDAPPDRHRVRERLAGRSLSEALASGELRCP